MNERIHLTNKEQNPELWDTSINLFLARLYDETKGNTMDAIQGIKLLKGLYIHDLNYLDGDSIEAIFEYCYKEELIELGR